MPKPTRRFAAELLGHQHHRSRKMFQTSSLMVRVPPSVPRLPRDGDQHSRTHTGGLAAQLGGM